MQIELLHPSEESVRGHAFTLFIRSPQLRGGYNAAPSLAFRRHLETLMRRSQSVVVALAIAAATLLTATCGGGGGNSGSGPVTAPTPVAQAQPPAVNVNDLGPPGGDNNLWSNGSVSFDAQTGSNTLGLQLTQTGAQVTGRFFLLRS
jgi:hypothetical protein